MKSVMILVLTIASFQAAAEWKIDLSRRQADLKKLEMDALAAEAKKQGPLDQVFEKEMPKEEVVIANTDKGFVPSVLKLKKDQIYQVTVVNVNKTKKNVSFMLDAFAEHHGTYFGEVVSFTVKPQKEGLFQFYCPESEYIGKLLVYGPEEKLDAVPPIEIRKPAQAELNFEHSSFLKGDNE